MKKELCFLLRIDSVIYNYFIDDDDEQMNDDDDDDEIKNICTNNDMLLYTIIDIYYDSCSKTSIAFNFQVSGKRAGEVRVGVRRAKFYLINK